MSASCQFHSKYGMEPEIVNKFYSSPANDMNVYVGESE